MGVGVDMQVEITCWPCLSGYLRSQMSCYLDNARPAILGGKDRHHIAYASKAEDKTPRNKQKSIDSLKGILITLYNRIPLIKTPTRIQSGGPRLEQWFSTVTVDAF